MAELGKRKIELCLPVPPPLNQRIIKTKYGIFTSYKSKKYKKDVAKLCKQFHVEPIKSEVSVDIFWYRERRTGDIDSRLKTLLDSLNQIAYDDDKQVCELSIFRLEDKNNPRMEVKIYEL